MRIASFERANRNPRNTIGKKFLLPPQFGGVAAELRREEKGCGGYANLGLRSLARSSLPCPRLYAVANSRLVEGCDSISLPCIPPTWALSWMHELATKFHEEPPLGESSLSEERAELVFRS